MTTPDFRFQPKFICLVISLANMGLITQAHAAEIDDTVMQDNVSDVMEVNVDSEKENEDKQSAPSNTQGVDSVSLQKVVVKGKRRLRRKDNEVTGLGQIVKSADDISEQQVLGIRDLTRYDPGVSVVEQGRGASSGYAIRGVDKNRVGLFVDGLPQAQSYLMQTTPIKICQIPAEQQLKRPIAVQ